MAPASQVRALVAKQRRLYVVLFGKEIGADVVGEPDERVQEMDAERERKWQALPRELKLAIKRIHVNLGHANTQTLLRALRISRASETATLADCSDAKIRNHACPDLASCPRWTSSMYRSAWTCCKRRTVQAMVEHSLPRNNVSGLCTFTANAFEPYGERSSGSIQQPLVVMGRLSRTRSRDGSGQVFLSRGG